MQLADVNSYDLWVMKFNFSTCAASRQDLILVLRSKFLLYLQTHTQVLPGLTERGSGFKEGFTGAACPPSSRLIGGAGCVC